MPLPIRIIIGMCAGAFLALLLFLAVAQKPAMAEVVINGVSYTVLIARTPMEHYRGLSGAREETLGAEGMLFAYLTSEPRTFTMRGMLFPLDVLWVREGVIVKIDTNIAEPLGGSAPLLMSSHPESVDTVIEFPANFTQKNGISVGDTVLKE